MSRWMFQRDTGVESTRVTAIGLKIDLHRDNDHTQLVRVMISKMNKNKERHSFLRLAFSSLLHVADEQQTNSHTQT